METGAEKKEGSVEEGKGKEEPPPWGGAAGCKDALAPCYHTVIYDTAETGEGRREEV